MAVKPYLSEEERQKIDKEFAERYQVYVREVRKAVDTFQTMVKERGKRRSEAQPGDTSRKLQRS